VSNQTVVVVSPIQNGAIDFVDTLKSTGDINWVIGALVLFVVIAMLLSVWRQDREDKRRRRNRF